MYDCNILMGIKEWNDKDTDPTYITECPHCNAPLRDKAVRCDICGWRTTRMLNYKRMKMVMGMCALNGETLAELLGLTGTHVSYITRGQRKANSEILAKLQRMFNLPWDWFTVRPLMSNSDELNVWKPWLRDNEGKNCDGNKLRWEYTE